MTAPCPECGNPPQYHSFCTLCCQLFRVPQPDTAGTVADTRAKWRDPELRARVAKLSADGLGAGKIAACLRLSMISVRDAMQYYGLVAPSRRRSLQSPASGATG